MTKIVICRRPDENATWELAPLVNSPTMAQERLYDPSLASSSFEIPEVYSGSSLYLIYTKTKERSGEE